VLLIVIDSNDNKTEIEDVSKAELDEIHVLGTLVRGK
jgi:hypothetical protein